MSEPDLLPLARWVAAFRYEDVATDTRQRLFTTVADWSSALLAGLGHPLYERYVAALLPFRTEHGPAHVAGQSVPRPLAQAAAANATISHFWEVDDAHRQSTSHPGITVVPAVMALAEAYPDIPLDRVRGAIVAGFEAVLRLGSYLGEPHYAVCHTTATAGTFGAAAASAHMLGLDADATLSAFGHAGTQAQGLWQILDDEVAEAKAFHAATAVRNGLAAAMLAKAGIPGARRVLEGRRGMLRAWHLSGGDRAWLVPDGSLMIHTVTVKNWPTCGQMHSALDCAEALTAAHAFKPADIGSVVVEVPQACLDIAGVETPQTVGQAKFSTAFCIAAVLAGRRPDFRGLNDGLLADAAIRALSGRVTVKLDPAFMARFPRERPARVSVTLSDGRTIVEERSFRRGDPELPWDAAALAERTRDVLALADRPLDAATLMDWCERFADPAATRWSAGELFNLAATPMPQPLEIAV
ncbi:MmgE/PrpD family protein [Mangrovicella endophytica]|uniref:MmgE/PrpD family protein n=1 Tax=Mangrovicella endophytica TaxID=2066697 RepID=UPI000C9E6716|nr:MmgE/PrpD family protein [Mangrovicella endophytica]